MKIVTFFFLMSAVVLATPISLDGRQVDVPTTVKNGRTMVELKALADQLGWQLEYRNGQAVVSTQRRQSVRAAEPIPQEEVLGPVDGSVITNLRPEIKARFTSLLDSASSFELRLNGKDVSDQAVLQANEIRWMPARSIGAGLHKVELTATTAGGEVLTRRWSFQVKNRLSY